jgi:hypothetical protein
MAVAESQRLTRQVAMLAGKVLGVGMNRTATVPRVQLRRVVGVVAQSENALGQTVFDDPAAGSVEAATCHAIPSPQDS